MWTFSAILLDIFSTVYRNVMATFIIPSLTLDATSILWIISLSDDTGPCQCPITSMIGFRKGRYFSNGYNDDAIFTVPHSISHRCQVIEHWFVVFSDNVPCSV